MFEKFVAPILRAQCERLDHVIYRLDDPEQINHVDYLLKIEKLYRPRRVPRVRMEKLGNVYGSDYRLPRYNKILSDDKRLVLSVPYNKILGLLDRLPTRKGAVMHSNVDIRDTKIY